MVKLTPTGRADVSPDANQERNSLGLDGVKSSFSRSQELQPALTDASQKAIIDAMNVFGKNGAAVNVTRIAPDAIFYIARHLFRA